MEKVIITGGAGFIGSHVVGMLTKQGFEPIVIDNLQTGKKENLPSGIRLYEVDIQNKRALENIFEKEKPSYVLHLAAQTSIRFSLNNPEVDAQINILGSINVLECVKKYKCKKFIYVTSGGTVYGEPKQIPTKETHPVGIITNYYGASKYSIEIYTKLYDYLYGIDYAIFRLANVYGPRQDPLGEGGVVAIFMGKMLNGEQPVIFGDGNQTRDYIYVTDVAAIIVLAMQKKTAEKIFNVGTGKETSVNNLFKKIQDTMQLKIPADHTEKIKGELVRSCLDSSLAKKEIGWQAQVNLDNGLKLTYQWLKENAKKF